MIIESLYDNHLYKCDFTLSTLIYAIRSRFDFFSQGHVINKVIYILYN